MVKIKPQRTQRITESCYFYLSPPLHPLRSLCSLWFSETVFRKYQKVSGILNAFTRDTKDPDLLDSCHSFKRVIRDKISIERSRMVTNDANRTNVRTSVQLPQNHGVFTGIFLILMDSMVFKRCQREWISNLCAFAPLRLRVLVSQFNAKSQRRRDAKVGEDTHDFPHTRGGYHYRPQKTSEPGIFDCADRRSL